MSQEKVIDATGLPVATTIETSDTVVLASGKKIDGAALKKAILEDISLSLIMDGVFIMYHSKNDGYPYMSRPHEWTSLQNAGEIADGVVVVEGGKVLVVAPTEANSAGLLWSSAPISGGATTTTDRITAINDWNGKANTASIIAASTSAAVTDTSVYAPGFCNLYSRVNANGKGLTAGKWWLPSLGEAMMISANMTKINYCLSLISGATQLLDDWYWTSTESSSDNAHLLYFSNGYFDHWHPKANSRGRVRPVSAFIN